MITKSCFFSFIDTTCLFAVINARFLLEDNAPLKGSISKGLNTMAAVGDDLNALMHQATG